MNEKIKTVVDDGFNMLLFGLPQGLPLGVVWLAYVAWAAVNRRRLLLPFRPSPVRGSS